MIQTAVILSTGDELTTGKVIDTNSAFIADRLFGAGIRVAAVLKVGDERDKLLWALAQARELGELIIGTGGLGPTADDLTTEVVAEFIGKSLVTDQSTAAALKRRFAARAIPWTVNNLKQARFPEGAAIIPNPVGSAPGAVKFSRKLSKSTASRNPSSTIWSNRSIWAHPPDFLSASIIRT